MKLEEKKFPRNLKGIAKGLEISGFGIVGYSVRSESGRMIALQDQAYYVPGLPNDLRIISPQGIRTSEGYKVVLWVILDVYPLNRFGLLPTWLILLQNKLHINHHAHQDNEL